MTEFSQVLVSSLIALHSLKMNPKIRRTSRESSDMSGLGINGLLSRTQRGNILQTLLSIRFQNISLISKMQAPFESVGLVQNIPPIKHRPDWKPGVPTPSHKGDVHKRSEGQEADRWGERRSGVGSCIPTCSVVWSPGSSVVWGSCLYGVFPDAQLAFGHGGKECLHGIIKEKAGFSLLTSAGRVPVTRWGLLPPFLEGMPTEHPVIQFHSDSESVRSHRLRAPEDCPRFKCQWQVMICHLCFWPTCCKSGVPVTLTVQNSGEYLMFTSLLLMMLFGGFFFFF